MCESRLLLNDVPVFHENLFKIQCSCQCSHQAAALRDSCKKIEMAHQKIQKFKALAFIAFNLVGHTYSVKVRISIAIKS